MIDTIQLSDFTETEVWNAFSINDVSTNSFSTFLQLMQQIKFLSLTLAFELV